MVPPVTSQQLDTFSKEVVDAVGRYGQTVVYWFPHSHVFRYCPAGGTQAARAMERDTWVGLYERGATDSDVYIDCSYYLSGLGHGML